MIDRDGLQIAFLGVALAHYLDVKSGDIVDLPLDDPPPGDPSRFRRIPTRTPESEAEDRRLFVEQVKAPHHRAQLSSVVHDATAFRSVLSQDRVAERAFFLFKNEQASRAVDEWLTREGLE